MKQVLLLAMAIALLSSCDSTRQLSLASNQGTTTEVDTLITQSLFNDKNSIISEEGIQKILDGNYKLPQQLRVAIVNLENHQRRYYWNDWSDEDYLKSRQSYLDMFAENFKQSPRVVNLSVIPNLLISNAPSFTNLREAAVRMQADIVVIYSINSDIYSKYKFFTRPDIKAFATTQLIILDVRTGLVPFSTIITKDYLSQKKKEEMDNAEARSRIQNEAVLLTIKEIGQKITGFLNTR